MCVFLGGEGGVPARGGGLGFVLLRGLFSGGRARLWGALLFFFGFFFSFGGDWERVVLGVVVVVVMVGMWRMEWEDGWA